MVRKNQPSHSLTSGGANDAAPNTQTPPAKRPGRRKLSEVERLMPFAWDKQKEVHPPNLQAFGLSSPEEQECNSDIVVVLDDEEEEANPPDNAGLQEAPVQHHPPTRHVPAAVPALGANLELQGHVRSQTASPTSDKEEREKRKRERKQGKREKKKRRLEKEQDRRRANEEEQQQQERASPEPSPTQELEYEAVLELDDEVTAPAAPRRPSQPMNDIPAPFVPAPAPGPVSTPPNANVNSHHTTALGSDGAATTSSSSISVFARRFLPINDQLPGGLQGRFLGQLLKNARDDRNQAIELAETFIESGDIINLVAFMQATVADT